MQKFINKLKNYLKSTDFKTALGSLGILVMLAVPLIIILVLLLLQNSYVTPAFWVIILIAILIFIFLINFYSVIYAKIDDNYHDNKRSKKAYWQIFLKELTGPFGVCLGIVSIVIYVDQLSKMLAVLHLFEGETVKFLNPIINFSLAFNKGAAWSMCYGHMNILAVISLIASLVMVFMLKDFDLKKRPLYSIALALILGGTIGNMIDRFFRVDGVVDFLEFGFINFPIFNIADSCLVIGTILFAISIIFTNPFNKKTNQENNLETKQEEKLPSLEEQSNPSGDSND